MRWLKAGIALAGLLLFLVLIVWVPVSASAYEGTSGLAMAVTATVQATPTVNVTATMTALNEEKLRQEIQQLKNQNGNQNNWLANNSTPLIAAITAIVVAFIGLYQWRGNQNAERKKELAAQDKELRDRQEAQDKELRDREDARRKEVEAQDKELRAQAEERFKAAVTALGSENEATQVGGAILLRSFLNPGDKEIYGRYYTQIFDLAVAYLRPSNTSRPSEDPNTPMLLTPLRQVLITVFKESFKRVRGEWKEQKPRSLTSDSGDYDRLGEVGIQLDQAYLVKADLRGVWMREASLRKARLYQAKFTGAHLKGADFTDAYMEDAQLNKTDLTRANFTRTKLLNAIFTEAYAARANFTEADLTGANPETAKSLNDAKMSAVTGLTKEQLAACKAKGAIIDEDTITTPPQPTPSSPTLLQSDDAQAPSASPAQMNTPPPSTDGSSSASSQPSTEP